MSKQSKKTKVSSSIKQFDVVTIGSATLDVHAKTDHTIKKISHKSLLTKMVSFPSGAKILIDELLYSVGGGGTNTAAAFTQLGFKTGYVGCLGTDTPSTDVQAYLKRMNISFLGHTVQKKTGYSIILDAGDSDRTILTFKGANNYLQAPKCKPFDAKWVYLCSMLGSSYQAQVTLVKHAVKNGAKIAFNPSEYQARHGMHSLHELLSLTSILILNKEEVELLAQDKVYPALRKLYELGVKVIVVTDGRHPVVVYDGDQYYSATPPQVKVIEATGAGDAFASSFVWAYHVSHGDISFAIQSGLLNSTSVITHHGAKEKLLTSKEIHTAIKKKEVIVHVHKTRPKLVI